MCVCRYLRFAHVLISANCSIAIVIRFLLLADFNNSIRNAIIEFFSLSNFIISFQWKIINSKDICPAHPVLSFTLHSSWVHLFAICFVCHMVANSIKTNAIGLSHESSRPQISDDQRFVGAFDLCEFGGCHFFPWFRYGPAVEMSFKHP